MYRTDLRIGGGVEICFPQHSKLLAFFIERFEFILLRDSENDLSHVNFSMVEKLSI